MSASVAICCIALNEELYIDEWLQHHFSLGFNHVYVYDNSPQEGTLKPRKNVTVIHMPGSVKQVDAYNNFMENFAEFHDWCAFIDVDEFFVLKKHATIQDYLLATALPHIPAIGVNWVLFGSDGQEKYEPRPVMERFTKGALNQHIKSIVRTSGYVKFENCHFPRDIPVTVHIPSNGKTDFVFNTPFNTNFDDSVIQLNHYFCKSREEFEKKIARGRADTNEKRNITELF